MWYYHVDSVDMLLPVIISVLFAQGVKQKVNKIDVRKSMFDTMSMVE